MKVAIDARLVYQEPDLRGIGKTLLALYRHMARLRRDWTFLMYYQVGNGRDPLACHPNVIPRPVEGKGDRFHAWQHVWLPLSVRLSGADLFHSHSGIVPRFSPCPMVTTIHDLIPLLEYYSERINSKHWKAKTVSTARRSRRVVTPSEYTRRQIHLVLGVPLDKISIVHWGPNEDCLSAHDKGQFADPRPRYGVEADRPYVLHFGMVDPRKNTRRVLEAWAQLPEALRRENALVVVGVQGQALADFRALVAQLGLSSGVRLHGYAPEADLPLLLGGAAALCYPSLSEGFGLPVLDAFACRTAVLTSNTTSLPEVAGEAALLVDPTSTEAVRVGLQRLLRDHDFRAELVNRGSERLKLFSWDHCAEQMADVFAAAC